MVFPDLCLLKTCQEPKRLKLLKRHHLRRWLSKNGNDPSISKCPVHQKLSEKPWFFTGCGGISGFSAGYGWCMLTHPIFCQFFWRFPKEPRDPHHMDTAAMHLHGATEATRPCAEDSKVEDREVGKLRHGNGTKMTWIWDLRWYNILYIISYYIISYYIISYMLCPVAIQQSEIYNIIYNLMTMRSFNLVFRVPCICQILSGLISWSKLGYHFEPPPRLCARFIQCFFWVFAPFKQKHQQNDGGCRYIMICCLTSSSISPKK